MTAISDGPVSSASRVGTPDDPRPPARRRFVDPTASERDFAEAELEFMRAMQDYKQQSGRMFPTWSEVLEVLTGLGYEKEPAEG